MLAVRFDQQEYLPLVYSYGTKMTPLLYENLEEAKNQFKEAYWAMPAGPMGYPPVFKKEFEKLATYQPVFLKTAPIETELQRFFDQYSTGGDLVEIDAPALLPYETLYCPIKKGTIGKHLALDVLRDIESIQSVNPDGKIIIQDFSVRYPGDPIKTKTEEDAKELLRKRGLL